MAADFTIAADCPPGSFLERLGELERGAEAPELSVEVTPGSESDRGAVFVALSSILAARRIAGRESRVSQDADANPFPFDAALRGGDRALAGTGITDLATARRLADEWAAALERATPDLPPSVVRMARFVFEELGANIVQHSGRPDTGFGVMQVREPDRRLELAFADRGAGFCASLQRNPEFAGRVEDDAEALQLALTPRVTGTAGTRANMGIGLKLFADLADLLGGELWIASGTAVLHRRTSGPAVHTNVVRPIAGWQGAWICLEAPLAT